MLPNEIWYHIFCHLEPEDLVKLRRVCKLFGDLVNDEVLSRKVMSKHYDRLPDSGRKSLNLYLNIKHKKYVDIFSPYLIKDFDEFHLLNCQYDHLALIFNHISGDLTLLELSTGDYHKISEVKFVKVAGSILVLIDLENILRVYDLTVKTDKLLEDSHCIIEYRCKDDRCRSVSVSKNRILITFKKFYILIIDRELKFFDHNVEDPIGYVFGDYIALESNIDLSAKFYDLAGRELYSFTYQYTIIGSYEEYILVRDHSDRSKRLGFFYIDGNELKIRYSDIDINGYPLLYIDGQYLISSRGPNVDKIYNLKTCELLCSITHKFNVYMTHFNGIFFVIGCRIQDMNKCIIYNFS